MAISVSAIITNYNYAQYLDASVRSALEQTQPPLEVIVVDDGSTDDSRERLQALQTSELSIKLIAQTNRGQLASLQAAARQARGDFIALLDADDIWEAQYLETVCQRLSLSPDVDFVFSNMTYFGDRQGMVLKRRRDMDFGLSVVHGAFAASHQYAPTSANVLRAPLFRSLLDVPEAMLEEWRTRADDCIGYGADILGARKYYLHQALVRYRSHDSNNYLNLSAAQSARILYLQRRETMFAFYRAKAGITNDMRAQAAQEFLAKRQVDARMFRGYARIVWKTPTIAVMVRMAQILRMVFKL